ncbi:MAG: 6-phosphogluconolactonase [Jatrophihabitantaceae bacterium]
MGAQPQTVVEESADALAASIAARLIAALTAALSVRPVAHLVLTGGGILEQVMRAVVDSPARDSLDWSRMHIWWGDERFVPSDSDDRNDKAAFAAFLGALPLDPALVHRMPASGGEWGEDVDAAAAAYAAELAAAAEDGDLPRFDVLLLGLGPDGHCASLFPDSPGVHEELLSVIGVHDSPKPPPLRMSLTFRTLDAASELWLIASGPGKAQAVARALGGASKFEVPSAGPRGREHTLWLIDRDAASELPAP